MLQTRNTDDAVEPHHLDVHALSVLAYFGDEPDRVYQLVQWLPVLELLDAHERVGIVLRDADTAAVVREQTTLPVLVAVEFAALRSLYAELDAKVALYCNNSLLNFQSLLEPRMLHVHINHGESDKQSMASNNAKSYDRVFVAGEAAVQRIASGLLEFDASKLVRIGRPQLDLVREPVLAPTQPPHRALRPDVGGRRRLQQLLLPGRVRARAGATPPRGPRRTRGLQAAPARDHQRRTPTCAPRTERSPAC